MSELIKKELKIGKVFLIFLKNGFRYEGRIIDIDNNFVKLFDFKSKSNRLISINSIENIEDRNGGARND